MNKFCKFKADGIVFKRLFVGMDVRKNYLQVAVLDEKGKILNNSRVDNNLIKVNEFFDALHPASNTKVVMESSGMWYNIYECMRKRHLDVRLSNPARTRAIASAKIKTDKLDAEKKVEAYNKIIKNEFISVEQISSIDEGKVRYDMFVNAYKETREHGGINGLTLSEMFLRTFNRSHTRTDTKQGGVTWLLSSHCTGCKGIVTMIITEKKGNARQDKPFNSYNKASNVPMISTIGSLG